MTNNLGSLLEGKHILLTGAGPNICRSIALEMAAQGGNLYFVDTDEKQGRTLEEELAKKGANAKFLKADLADMTSVQNLHQSLSQEEIPFDILVNGVGVMSRQVGQKSSDEINVEVWRRMLDTNLLGPYYLTRLIAKDMIEAGRGGSILFLSTVHEWSYYGDPMYSGAKAAVGMIVKELAIQFAPYNIRVNSIAPGWVKSLTEEEKRRMPPPRDTLAPNCD